MEISNLSVSGILKDISLSLEPGSCSFLLGSNGSGKSTFLKALAGHIKYSGTVTSHLSNKFYLPQEFGFSSELKVFDLMFMSSYGGVWDVKRAKECLSMFELESCLNSLLSEMSSGQRQKALLAAALYKGSDYMFLDEPTSFLDPVARCDLFRALENAPQCTMLIASHDLELVSKFGSRVIGLKNGELYYQGELKELCCDSLYS